ncbi:PREDICTED: Na(+)/H(+) exchange regulatory cofactor NHE-RF1-like [Cyprinodon variegatus]|uniref:Na(+)/H(+) exchange regulatory cofactor NHE-RF n=1 Tax=Cyprinodon variegatus TaxID=28743 RepID=A0A3Q2GJW4_CYPVA|nr:PREDICTED: Na(+)/H(+) exchange regulatory cofactor NHE-RF1-like [Cyprinodon variegatus]
MSQLRPRLCVLEKGTKGYGFHLHGEKGKTGQFIRLVEDDSPASRAGLLAKDRLMFVNGENVEGESHQQVVARIRATVGALELIVVDPETAELLSKHSLQCRKEYVTEGIPLPGGDSDSEREDRRSNGSPVPRENGDRSSVRSGSVSSSTKVERDGPRPRLCHMRKGSSGYGFNLHSEKNKPGQYIRAVDDDSPAQRAGLRPQDKILEVNGKSVVGLHHSEVVAAIKAGGNETRLLVVDAEAEEFFIRCNIEPTEDYIRGPLPEPGSERGSDEEVASQLKHTLSVSSHASSASSNASQPAAERSSPPPRVERSPEPESSPTDDGLGLSMSLAQARERARQKRASKKAPPMDWSKRNELFSNL